VHEENTLVIETTELIYFQVVRFGRENMENSMNNMQNSEYGIW
jgi:hypothetical protein